MFLWVIVGNFGFVGGFIKGDIDVNLEVSIFGEGRVEVVEDGVFLDSFW